MEEIIEYHETLTTELNEIAASGSVSVDEAFFERMANRLEMEGHASPQKGTSCRAGG